MFPPIYVILDAPSCRMPAVDFAELLIGAGAQILQYRDKQAVSRELLGGARDLVKRLRPRGARLIVNDRPDIAALADADGVHVGQDDVPVEAARMFCRRPAWVGISTHTLEQVSAAASTTADYVAVGPVYATTTKTHHDPVVGPEFIRRARRLTRKPIVAVGGITLGSAEEVFKAGADSVAVAGDLLRAPEPELRLLEYLGLAAALRPSDSTPGEPDGTETTSG